MRRVLIANRGEIAVRIIEACRERGIATVAVYAEADAEALHVRRADQAWSLDGQTPAETYLNQEKLLEIASRTEATDVHPGYGFLSESAEFARAVTAAGLRWIGPPPEAIEALGDKIRARQIATAAGAPLAPGTDGPLGDAQEARDFAEEHGLPIIIKAAHGGGGRGMRVVRQIEQVEAAFEDAAREARGAFGRGECFVERFLERPRHVEAQVIADEHGGVLVFGTRDCSLQRRNQKLIEEAPAPSLTPQQREEIESSSARILREAGYVNAGTCEFLVAEDGLISFLEVNTRIQVEHPVTEQSYGVDLVGMQLDVAAGRPLPLAQAPEPSGHSFEFRINAEDPGRGFLPAGGRIRAVQWPTGPGIRVDAGVQAGDEVAGEFDSMLAKLIVTAPTRETAVRRARQALAQTAVDGVSTTLPFHRAALEHEDFTGEDFRVHTTWIEDVLTPGLKDDAGYAAPAYADPELPGRAPAEGGAVSAGVEIDGKLTRVRIPAAALRALGEGLAAQGVGLQGSGGGSEAGGRSEAGGGAGSGEAASSGSGESAAQAVEAPMSGTLLRWEAEDGAQVSAGQTLAVLEAMKTELPVEAPAAGVWHRAEVQTGEKLRSGEALGRIEG